MTDRGLAIERLGLLLADIEDPDEKVVVGHEYLRLSLEAEQEARVAAERACRVLQASFKEAITALDEVNAAFHATAARVLAIGLEDEQIKQTVLVGLKKLKLVLKKLEG